MIEIQNNGYLSIDKPHIIDAKVKRRGESGGITHHTLCFQALLYIIIIISKYTMIRHVLMVNLEKSKEL